MPYIVVQPTFEKAFKEINSLVLNQYDFELDSRIGKTREIINLSYYVDEVDSFVLEDTRINRIGYDYAETFYDFMMTGGTTDAAREAFKDFPQANPFISAPKSDSLPENFNTLYGPRIVKQLPAVIQELKDHPETRRACIMILSENDHALLALDEKIEYPCTMNSSYVIREGKMYGHCNMRSQNVATVLQIDMYIQARLLKHIAAEVGVEVGGFGANLISAHIYERDFEYVENFLS